MKPRPRSSVLLTAALLAGALASAAPADWLVMSDGSRIETDGAWRVEGQRLLFRTRGGTLSALRLAQVDLSASETATAQAKAPKPASAPAATSQRPPSLVLTAATNRPQRRAPASETTAEDGGAAATHSPSGRLQVEDWKEAQTGGFDLELEGTLHNGSSEFATDIELEVTVFDADGNPAGTKNATVDREGLLPGERAKWRAAFPGIFSVNGASFKVSNRALVTNKAPSAAPNPGGR